MSEYEQDKSYTDEMDNDINHPVNQKLYEDVLDFVLNSIVQDLTEFGRLEELISQYELYFPQDNKVILPKIEDEVGREIIKRLQPKEES